VQNYISLSLQIKGFQICAYLLSSFNGCKFLSNFVIDHKIKSAKYIFDPCCHLLADMLPKQSAQQHPVK